MCISAISRCLNPDGGLNQPSVRIKCTLHVCRFVRSERYKPLRLSGYLCLGTCAVFTCVWVHICIQLYACLTAQSIASCKVWPFASTFRYLAELSSWIFFNFIFTVVKHMWQTIYHFNPFWVYDPVALTTFTVLGTQSPLSSPQIFHHSKGNCNQ